MHTRVQRDSRAGNLAARPRRDALEHSPAHAPENRPSTGVGQCRAQRNDKRNDRNSSATENSVSVTLAKERHSFEHLARNRDAWQVRESDFSAH
jgi:hypothetical protein